MNRIALFCLVWIGTSVILGGRLWTFPHGVKRALELRMILPPHSGHHLKKQVS